MFFLFACFCLVLAIPSGIYILLLALSLENSPVGIWKTIWDAEDQPQVDSICKANTQSTVLLLWSLENYVLDGKSVIDYMENILLAWKNWLLFFFHILQ